MVKRLSYTGLIKDLPENGIFVFGSNPEGRHGLGTAKLARDKFGARYGQGRGIMGQSYGLITKNLRKDYFEKETGIKYTRVGDKSVSHEMIVDNIRELYSYARKHRENVFYIAYTRNGKLLNGYTPKEMAKMFREAGRIPKNIIFEKGFLLLIKEL